MLRSIHSGKVSVSYLLALCIFKARYQGISRELFRTRVVLLTEAYLLGIVFPENFWLFVKQYALKFECQFLPIPVSKFFVVLSPWFASWITIQRWWWTVNFPIEDFGMKYQLTRKPVTTLLCSSTYKCMRKSMKVICCYFKNLVQYCNMITLILVFSFKMHWLCIAVCFWCCR